jgi:hypothetical protein
VSDPKLDHNQNDSPQTLKLLEATANRFDENMRGMLGRSLPESTHRLGSLHWRVDGRSMGWNQVLHWTSLSMMKADNLGTSAVSRSVTKPKH